MTSEQRVVGYGGMWARPEEDPRQAGNPVGELATIREYLTNYRRTLGLKCEGLTPEQLATRSVPPSTMSLLGLVRHLAKVEHVWFQLALRGVDEPRLFWSADVRDVDFDGAVADPAVVAEAFAAWESQIAAADEWLDRATDLGAEVTLSWNGEKSTVRDILIHMIEEYARHCGHADLLRECIDGRTGQ
ncbi:DinB family protein [Actinoplanes oblitus]|uniref:DinB family protein n=1 Tax=Actinoplanes oblitus TaxID=3040509 RepID=A0ABY8WU58_9ACTN|nr:DinB family protein [Actinoplanes oblitus]WIM99375.1 DinB family protein [Actinoplanes oblitus]